MKVEDAVKQVLFFGIWLGIVGGFFLCLVTAPERAVALAVFMVAVGVNSPRK